MSKLILSIGIERLNQFDEKWPDLACKAEEQLELKRLFSLSDFIFEQCIRHRTVAEHLLSSIQSKFTTPLLAFDDFASDYLSLDENAFTSLVRLYRQLVMVELAAKDFLGKQPIESTMSALSLLADQFFIACRSWSVGQLSARWGWALSSDGQPVELIALGMGKLGGLELNFSSDIDLIFCYAEKGQTQGGRKSEDFQTYFTKLAQKIIQLLDSVTAEGRVFRVDMRLRPFGESGPLVSSFDAIEDYYQEQGREWERYALLKARPLGANQNISKREKYHQDRLTSLLKPFVYRRYIDFSVIDSLRSMKRMIRQEVIRRQLDLNIKLGEGGIREVEFIVQAMQMLRGGKEAQLQQPSLLAVLPEFTLLNVFSSQETRQIREDYLWLRRCEQYLQAFGDQQTQTLPQDELNRQRLLLLFEKATWSEFLEQLAQLNRRIHLIFDDVIGDPEQQQAQQNLPDLTRWQSCWQHREEHLDDDAIWPLVESMKPELVRAVSGARGREKLDMLMPILLWQMVEQELDQNQMGEVLVLIRQIASRTTYLELLLENHGALAQLVKLCASCRFIGNQLSKFPLLLDQLIDPKLLYQVPDINSYKEELRRYLLRIEPEDLEQQMEVLRQFKLTSQLVIAACDVEKISSLVQVSDHLTAIAEACLHHSVNLAWQQMIERYGYPDGASDENKNFAVLGYGKLGGFELGYGSDLDVVFIHSCLSSEPTGGKKAIDSRQFYLKLAQRIMHLFTTRTMSGQLYEIDTRLRPSGASGLLAIHIDTFAEYQQTEAWTWEHQALVRSRMVIGSNELESGFKQIKKRILCQARELDELKLDISRMRQKMFDNLAKEKPDSFDLKQSRGGIADIEFISQYLVLAFSHKHPELELYPDNLRILKQAVLSGVLEKEDCDALIQAYVQYRQLYHQASLNNEEKHSPLSLVASHSIAVKRVWAKLLA